MQQDMGRNKLIKSKTLVIQCSFCDLWTCASCTKFKKSDLTVMSRNDVLRSCHSCMQSMKKQTRQIQGTHELQEQITELKQTIENKIKSAIQNSVPKAVEKILDTTGVSESVNANVNKLWSETLGDPADFPALDSEEAKLAAKKPKQNTIEKVVKKAVLEQKNDELRRDNNIIIFNAEEPTEPEINKRKDHDQKVVTDLLKAIEVETTPVQIVRLGAFNKKTREQQKP